MSIEESTSIHHRGYSHQAQSREARVPSKNHHMSSNEPKALPSLQSPMDVTSLSRELAQLSSGPGASASSLGAFASQWFSAASKSINNPYAIASGANPSSSGNDALAGAISTNPGGAAPDANQQMVTMMSQMCQAMTQMMQMMTKMMQKDGQNAKTGQSPATDPNSGTDTQNKPGTDPAPPTGKNMGKAEGTGYYPANNAMEGGTNDMKGKKLNTLQDFLSGKAPYVSIALDKNLYSKGVVKYGDTFRIPELEKKYGKPIIFKAVDTGGAFTNKGFGRVDICTGSEKDSEDSGVNGSLTLMKA